MQDLSNALLFAGRSNRPLAEQIAHCLRMQLSKADIDTFSDGEVNVCIPENVRGKKVFVIQSTAPPVNDHYMELLVLIDALRRASCDQITVVMPYFGYSRQDCRARSARLPISARMVADLLESVGMHRLLTVELHAEQIEGFFKVPVDNLFGTQSMLTEVADWSAPNVCIVSPDVGGVMRASLVSDYLNCKLAIIDKRRAQPNTAEVMHIIGDVTGKCCWIFDDMVDTAGTLCEAALALKTRGALQVNACCIHPVLSGDAIDRINRSVLSRVVVSDSIMLNEDAQSCPKLFQVSVAPLLAEAIRRICAKESIAQMYLLS